MYGRPFQKEQYANQCLRTTSIKEKSKNACILIVHKTAIVTIENRSETIRRHNVTAVGLPLRI